MSEAKLQKVQPVVEWRSVVTERQWCEGPDDRQDHSRDHVEERCERESNKRKDGTFHRDNTTTCTTHHCTPARKHELAL